MFRCTAYASLLNLTPREMIKAKFKRNAEWRDKGQQNETREFVENTTWPPKKSKILPLYGFAG